MKKDNKLSFCLLFLGICTTVNLAAQLPQKQVTQNYQAWISNNSTWRFTDKWGMVVDYHYRSNHFFTDPNFHFFRIGANYWIKDNLTVTAGLAHMWLAPSKTGWHTYANENRIYQQVQLIQKIGSVSLLQRIRNEQRWQDKIVNDKRTGDYKFTNRVRYLLSLNIPLKPKDKNFPSLVLADEFFMHFGKEVVYNTFEQNRFFVGIRQRVTHNLNFDMGYMNLYQQKSSGYQYDENHTFRWFFYYTPDFRKKHKA